MARDAAGRFTSGGGGGGLSLATAVVSITGNDAPLRNAISGAKAATDKGVAAIQASWRKLGDTFARVGKRMMMFVTLPIITATGLAVRAYMKQEDAENSLTAALQNRGAATDQLMPKFKAFAVDMQKQTIYGDELVLSQMAYAANLGITTDKLEEATKAAIGLAAKFRIDLQTAMMLVGRAALGQTQMLTRYGIVLDETLTSQEKFNALLKIGAASFRLAQAETRTFTGAVRQMRNALGDAMEEGAKPLIPVLRDLARNVKELSEWYQGLSTATKQSVLVFSGLAAALGPVLRMFGALLGLRVSLHFLGMTKHVATLGLLMKGLGVAALAVGIAIAGWTLGNIIGEALHLEKVFLRIAGIPLLKEAQTATEAGAAAYEQEKRARLEQRGAALGISGVELERLEILKAQGQVAARNRQIEVKGVADSILLEARANLVALSRAKAVQAAEQALLKTEFAELDKLLKKKKELAAPIIMGIRAIWERGMTGEQSAAATPNLVAATAAPGRPTAGYGVSAYGTSRYGGPGTLSKDESAALIEIAKNTKVTAEKPGGLF